MLFLLFELGTDRYALDALQIAEVLPLVAIKRIVLVHYPGGDGATHLLGLIVEKATQTVRHAPADFVASGITTADAPYLGPVATDARGLLQWIDVQTLLPPAFRDMLFNQPMDDRWGLPT